jgi:hypothetical protein
MRLHTLEKELAQFSNELNRIRGSTNKTSLPNKQTEEFAFEILRKIVSATEPFFCLENESSKIKTKQFEIRYYGDWVEFFFERTVYENEISIVNYLGVAVRPNGAFTYYGDRSSYADGERESITGTVLYQQEETTDLEEIIKFVNTYFTKK